MKRLTNTKALFLTLLTLIVFSISSVRAEDLDRIVNLSGYWKFTIGTDEEWSKADYDDSDWDEIMVPRSWEHEGYDDYNGYAWYRKKISMPQHAHHQQLYLVLGKIDDADEVYLNGQLIGKKGDFPPKFTTAYGQERRYPIPANLIRHNGQNTIAIKVYDSYDRGGITEGRIGIYIDRDHAYLDFVLSGEWKFNTGDNKYWRTAEFDDSNWNSIPVPARWEEYGYADYDGYAWYRKTFAMPQNLKQKELYISLGKIDDYDQVYFNGELIGNVFELEKDGDYRSKGWEYNARRVYKIPANLIKTENTVAVRVYDKIWDGGIYEGPIGLMTHENYIAYKKKHHKGRSFWDYINDAYF